MDENLKSILAGAGISLIASIFTALVSFIFQYISEGRKRKWEMEDKTNEKLSLIKTNKVDVIKENINKLAFISNQCIEAERKVLLYFQKPPHLDMADIKNNFSVWREPIEIETRAYVTNHSHELFATSNLDPKITEYMGKVLEELNHYDSICNSYLNSNKIDLPKEQERLTNFVIDLQRMRGDILIQLEKYLIN